MNKKKIKRLLKNTYFHTLIALSLFFISTSWFIFDNSIPGYEYRWLNCIDYLKEGTLYGGQPYCVQGPVIYLFGLIVKLLSLPLQLFAKILNILLNGMLFYLVANVVKKDFKKSYILPVLFFYYYSIFSFSLTLLEVLFSTIFAFSGFYVLFYTKFKHKEIITGILFLLSLLSKLSSLFAIILIYLAYVFTIEKLNLRINKKTLLKVVASKRIRLLTLKVIILPIFLLILFFIFYNQSFAYLVSVPAWGTSKFSRNIVQGITEQFSFNIKQDQELFTRLPELVSTITILLFIIGLFLYRKPVFLIYSLGLFLTNINLYRITNPVGLSKYTLVFTPFLVIGVTYFINNMVKIRIPLKNYDKLFLVAGVIILIYLSPITISAFKYFSIGELLSINNNGIMLKYREMIEAPWSQFRFDEEKILISGIPDDIAQDLHVKGSNTGNYNQFLFMNPEMKKKLMCLFLQ